MRTKEDSHVKDDSYKRIGNLFYSFRSRVRSGSCIPLSEEICRHRKVLVPGSCELGSSVQRLEVPSEKEGRETNPILKVVMVNYSKDMEKSVRIQINK